MAVGTQQQEATPTTLIKTCRASMDEDLVVVPPNFHSSTQQIHLLGFRCLGWNQAAIALAIANNGGAARELCTHMRFSLDVLHVINYQEPGSNSAILYQALSRPILLGSGARIRACSFLLGRPCSRP